MSVCCAHINALREELERRLHQGVRALKAATQEVLGNRRRLASYILERLRQDGIHPTCIVDHGCGTGTTAVAFAKLAPDAKVYGTDVKSHRASISTPANVEFRAIEPCRLRHEGLRPDVVLVSGVLHHIARASEDAFLADIAEAIPPHARLFVHEHRLATHRFRQAIEKALLRRLEVLGGIEHMSRFYNYYTRARLVDLLKTHGFEIIEMQDVEGRFFTLPTLNGNMLLYWERRASSR